MKHVIVVDDEKNIRDLIKIYLEKEGYRVTLLADGSRLMDEMAKGTSDLLILDIMLPGTDGLELCKKIRNKYDTPVIFVSARDEEFDRILGLELGADDYLTKPFSPRELMVRIKNIFKRMDKSPNNSPNDIIKDIKLCTGRRLVEKDGLDITLTTREFELLSFLILNRNISFTRETLIEKVWGYDYMGESRVVDDLVKRIRRKLQDNGAKLEIKTIWGYGYRIDD